MQHITKNNYKNFIVFYNRKDNDNYQNNDNFCCGNASKGNSKSGGVINNENAELFQYYYHSYHLGSASYITNLSGDIVQHVEYVPFGEVFLEEKNNKWNTPYLFNGKELDEETGLYYYGARYYEPRSSLFINVDPLVEKTMQSYAYCSNNPIMKIDPNGMSDDWVERDGKVTYDKDVTSERTKKAGDKYLGKQGYGINENTGNLTSYNADGTQSNAGSILLDDVIVSGESVSSQRGDGLNTANNIAGGIGTVGTGAGMVDGTFRVSKGGTFSPKYYASGWKGGSAARITTFGVSKVGNAVSSGANVVTTGIAYYQIADGSAKPITYVDAGVGTMGVIATYASYFHGAQIPIVGEFVAGYGIARVTWDVFFNLGAQYGPSKWYGTDDTKWFK